MKDAPYPEDQSVEMLERFGPHLAYMRGKRSATDLEPDRVVKTHCCFCGQQCGMKLKVKDEEIIGIEPWYEFPFNKGKMCPKGIKRYLQDRKSTRLNSSHVRISYAV